MQWGGDEDDGEITPPSSPNYMEDWPEEPPALERQVGWGQASLLERARNDEEEFARLGW